MSRRRPIIAGNWKMFKTAEEAVETARTLVSGIRGDASADVMIAPSYVSLAAVAQCVQGTPVGLGAQNLHWEKEGAFTGEISAEMLTSAGCEYVIIGHSERRQFFGETDETVNLKIRAAVASGLTPVLCVGETENEREEKKTNSVLDKQVTSGLKNIASGSLERLVIAYEPVWAIGTGKTATAETAQEAHACIRERLKSLYGSDFAESIRIQYGGSVKPGNIRELMTMPDVDGALVGGASLDADVFLKIVHFEQS